MKDLKRIFSYLGPYRKDLVFGAFLVVVETSFELIIPVLMAGIIDTASPAATWPTFCTRASRWACAPCWPC